MSVLTRALLSLGMLLGFATLMTWLAPREWDGSGRLADVAIELGAFGLLFYALRSIWRWPGSTS